MSRSEYRQRLIVPGELKGERFDRALNVLIPEFSRSQIVRWMVEGAVSVNGELVKPSRHVQGGEEVKICAEWSNTEEWQPESGVEFKIAYEDADLVVVDKPCNLVVHPGAGNWEGTLVNGLISRMPELAMLPRAGVVHRLDKDTSGLMVLGRTETATRLLSEAIAAHKIERRYLAVTEGVLNAATSVREPIGRHPRNRLKQSVRKDGRSAVTHFRTLEQFRNHSLVEARLETGRTHQIRVHLSWLRHPVAGDRFYGAVGRLPKYPTEELVHTVRNLKRQALHAARLGLVHPISGKSLLFRSPLPDDIENLIGVLRSDRDTLVD